MKKGNPVKKAAIVLAVAFSALSLLMVAGCGSGAWTNTGGTVSCYDCGPLAYDSTHNLLYAGCGVSSNDNTPFTGKGVWKYNGSTWTNTGGEVASFEIDSLAYDSNHNLLYAGCIDSSTGTYIYKGVWKYDGTTWTNTGGAVSIFIIPCLAYDPIHNLLYAGTDGVDVWKYDGKNWTDTGSELAGDQFCSLAYDSTHKLLYARAGGDVWKYDGTTWTNTGTAFSNYCGAGPLLYDSTHKLLYAGTDSKGVWKYDGSTWTKTGGAFPNYKIDSLAYDPTHNLLYAGCEVMQTLTTNGSKGKGVWKYDGTAWVSTGGSVSGYLVGPLTYDSTHNLLYAGCGVSSNDNTTFTGKGVWRYQ